MWTRRFRLAMRRRDGGALPSWWHQAVGRVALRRGEVLIAGSALPNLTLHHSPPNPALATALSGYENKPRGLMSHPLLS